MFTCDHCEEKFEDKKEMQRHVTKHKQDEPAEVEQHVDLLQELHQEEHGVGGLGELPDGGEETQEHMPRH